MTEDLRSLLANAAGEDAHAVSGEAFHGTFGESVRGRVRRRRAVRAAGVGSVAAVSVGAIAFGAVRLPGVVDAQPGLPSSSASSQAGCPPGSWWVDPTLGADDVSYSKRDPDDDDWQSSDAPGVGVQTMTLDDGVVTTIFDDATGDVMAMVELVASSVSEDLLHVMIAEDEALVVASDLDGSYTFELRDGRWLTVDSAGENVVALADAQPDPASASMAPDEGVGWDEAASAWARDFPLDWPESPWVCVGPDGEEGDEGEAEPTASPSSASSEGGNSATPSSPYQCGYVLPADGRLPAEWSIVGQEWMSPEEAWVELSDRFGSTIDRALLEPTDPVLRLEADGSLFDDTGTGQSGGELTFEDPGDPAATDVYEQWPLYESYDAQSLGVVAVDDGTVVGYLDYGVYGDGPAGLYVGSAGRDVADYRGQEFFMLDRAALTPCPSFSGDLTQATLYGVSGAVRQVDGGTITGPFYGWQEIVRP